VEHVVFFPAPDGSPAFRRLPTLDDAARFVEQLRNVENVTEASVHSLTEIPLAFKAWYRVELPEAETVADIVSTVQLPSHLEIPAPATIAEAIESFGYGVSTPPARQVDLPEALGWSAGSAQGSATGIVVPDRAFVSQEQFAYASPAPVDSEYRPGGLDPRPSGFEPRSSSFEPRPSSTDARPSVAHDDTPAPAVAQVLQPAFGVPRDRGIGYFAR
jgi:hypothetical protein